MNYYKAGALFIQFHSSTNVYRIRNSIASGNKTISLEEFGSLAAAQITKQKFCELMNNFFRSIQYEWKHEDFYFRKLENFDKYGKSSGINWTDLPSHQVETIRNVELKCVYHWGRVYYIIYGENYAPKGQLVDIYKLQVVRWVDIKNVAPILNIGTQKIV